MVFFEFSLKSLFLLLAQKIHIMNLFVVHAHKTELAYFFLRQFGHDIIIIYELGHNTGTSLMEWEYDGSFSVEFPWDFDLPSEFLSFVYSMLSHYQSSCSCF